jgi:8-oxo-dGTP pyrophosphatase MutT (NUDIX family)
MIISDSMLRKIIKSEILELLTFPKHSKHSGFELYTEDDAESTPSGKSEEAKLKNAGAGFLIGRIFPEGEIKFLGLVASKKMQNKKGGIYDIPKGKLKKGENKFQGAVRECEEESGISVKISDVIGDPVDYKNLTLFLAATSQDPKISPNPDSGIVEHEGFAWLTRDNLVKSCLSYLKPAVRILADRFIDSVDKN